MSRSGYTDDPGSEWEAICWRGQVASAIRGKRGQAFLRELIEALDAMPEKRLISHELRKGAEVCALGSVGARRGIELEVLDPEDCNKLADVFGVAHQLVREIEWMNDEAFYFSTPEMRWQNIRDWAAGRLKEPARVMAGGAP